LARCLGIGLAGITYYCLPRVKKVGLANIDLAYGDTLSDAEKRRILWASVRAQAPGFDALRCIAAFDRLFCR